MIDCIIWAEGEELKSAGSYGNSRSCLNQDINEPTLSFLGNLCWQKILGLPWPSVSEPLCCSELNPPTFCMYEGC